MRRPRHWPFTVLLMWSLLGGCSRPGVPEEGLALCSDPRPEICTREYLPVCGRADDDARKTYGNKCEACADPTVVGYRPGAC